MTPFPGTRLGPYDIAGAVRAGGTSEAYRAWARFIAMGMIEGEDLAPGQPNKERCPEELMG